MGAGLLEMREPKSVTVGIQRRGWWDVIRLRNNEQELEVEIVKDVVVYCSKVLEFELGGLHLEPLKEGNLVIVEVRSLKDVKVPLMLLCVSWWVVDMAGNGGLV